MLSTNPNGLLHFWQPATS